MRNHIFAASLIAASVAGMLSPSASASLYSDAVTSTPGLVGYWQLGETLGNYADSSSKGNFGVPGAHVIQGVAGPRPTDGFLGFDATHNAAGFNSAINGKSDGMGFDDSQGYIDIANPAGGILDPGTGNYTISMWFKVPSDGNLYTMLSKGLSAHDGWMFERLDSNEGRFSNWINANMAGPDGYGYGPESAFYVAPPTWQNLVVVLHRNGNATPGYPDSGISMFINARSINENSTTDFDPAFDATSTADLEIGAFRSAGLEAFSGSISDVAIFNDALTPTQIANLYNVGLTGTVPEPMLLTIGALPVMLLFRRSSRHRR